MPVVQGLAVAFVAVMLGLVLMTRGSSLVQGGGLRTVAGVPVVLAGTAILAMGLMVSTGTWLRVAAIVIHR